MPKPDAFRAPIGESACELEQLNYRDKADHRREPRINTHPHWPDLHHPHSRE